MKTVMQRAAELKAAKIAARKSGVVTTTKSAGIGTWLLEQQDKLIRNMDDFANTSAALAAVREEDRIRSFGLFERKVEAE